MALRVERLGLGRRAVEVVGAEPGLVDADVARGRGDRGTARPDVVAESHRGPIVSSKGVPPSLAVDDLLAGLNEPQRAAVTHPEGPLLVLAGAGSGKTRVLTHRIAWLVATERARAGEILAITFTNKAAQEMRERVELLLGHSTRTMWVMTFHAACARILRAEAPRLGYTRQYTIYDQADARRWSRSASTPSAPTPSATRRQRSTTRSPTPRTSCATRTPTASWSAAPATGSNRRPPTSTSSTSAS